MSSSNLDAAVGSRMSTRAFLPTPVAPDQIRAVLQCAVQATDNAGSPAWQVHVLQGQSQRSLCDTVCAAHDAARADPGLLALHPERYAYYPERWFSPYIERRRENGWGLYGLLGIGKADKDRMHAQHQRNFRFFDAPVGLMFTVPHCQGWHGLLHYGAMLQSVMVAARAVGLHTCPQAAWNGFAHIVLPHVRAPADAVLVCGMALGHADPANIVNTYVTPRLPAADFSSWRED